MVLSLLAEMVPHLGDLSLVLAGLAQLLELVGHCLDGLIDAALDLHGVGALP